MSLPSTYLNELKSLDREILKSQPSDILQFCANFFSRRLESQRAEFLLALQHPMSGLGTNNKSSLPESTFPGMNPFSANGGGGFGGGKGGSFGTSGMHKLEEEDENDT